MRKLVFAGALCLPLTAIGAQPPAAQSNADPNEMVCRNLRETGSRLNTNRVCMTRQQWAERRREARQNIDRAQTNRVYPGQ